MLRYVTIWLIDLLAWLHLALGLRRDNDAMEGLDENIPIPLRSRRCFRGDQTNGNGWVPMAMPGLSRHGGAGVLTPMLALAPGPW